MPALRFPELNRVVLAGRLTQEPEPRLTASGKLLATLRIAINRSYRDRSGEWQQEATFVSVVAWGKTAEAAAARLSLWLLCGRVPPRRVIGRRISAR